MVCARKKNSARSSIQTRHRKCSFSRISTAFDFQTSPPVVRMNDTRMGPKATLINGSTLKYPLFVHQLQQALGRSHFTTKSIGLLLFNQFGGTGSRHRKLPGCYVNSSIDCHVFTKNQHLEKTLRTNISTFYHHVTRSSSRGGAGGGGRSLRSG